MKKRKIKGFTLIECIIALFILGLSSLLLVQAYSQLMKVTKMSNTANISISKQMDDAEKKTDANATKLTTTPRKITVTTRQIGTGTATSLNVTNYSFDVDSYQVKGKNLDGTDASSGSEADSMRYIYFK